MKDKVLKGLIAWIVIMIFVGALYFAITGAEAKVQPMNSVPVNGYFIDVNGDGRLDYVITSDVIINDGDVNLPPSP